MDYFKKEIEMEERDFADHFYVSLETAGAGKKMSVSGDALVRNFKRTNKTFTIKSIFEWAANEVLGGHEDNNAKKLEDVINGVPGISEYAHRYDDFSTKIANGRIVVMCKDEYFCTISIDVVNEHRWNAITFTFYK